MKSFSARSIFNTIIQHHSSGNGKAQAGDDEISESLTLEIDYFGTIRHINDSSALKLGYHRKELVGQPLSLIHIMEPGFVYKDPAEEKNKDSVARPPMALKKKNGVLIPVTSNMKHVTWKFHQYLLLSFTEIFADDTDRDESSVQGRSLFSMFRNSADLLTVSSLEDKRLVEASHVWLQTLGYTRSEVIGKTVEQLGLWDSPDLREMFVEQLKNHKEIRDFELIARTKTGGKKLISFSCEIIHIYGSSFLLSIGKDLTGQKEAERMTSPVPEKTGGLPTLLPDWYIETDLSGNILTMQGETSTWLNNGHYTPKHLLDLFPEDVSSLFLGYLNEAAELGFRKSFEFSLPGEENLFFEARIVAINYEKVLIIIRNISSWKKAMAEKEYFRDFEHLVSGISSVFININPGRIDSTINSSLMQFGEFLQVDRTFIFIRGKDGESFSNPYEWCADGITSNKSHFIYCKLSSFPWITGMCKKGERILIRDISDLPPEASSEREIFRSLGLKAVGITQIFHGSELMGVIGFEGLKNDEPHMSTKLGLTRIVGETLFNALERKHDHDKMFDLQSHLLDMVDTRTKALSDTNKVLEDEICLRQDAQKNLNLLWNAIENLAEGVLITSQEGIIEYVNPAYLELMGYTKEEVIGKNPRIFKSGKQPLVFYQNLFSQISSGKTWQGKLTNKKKDGSLVEERMVISPVINEKGIIEYYIAIKQDVTVESQMEKELRQAEKMQAIGTLAGGIAHDFNNILQIIQIYNDLLISDTSENDRMLRNAGEINNAVHRGKDLVHAILTYTSQTDVELNVQPLEPLIRESLAFIKAMLPTAVSISEHLTPVGEILCNSTNIQQIIMNLVNNASFAMDYKGRISISLTRVSRPVLKGKTHSGEWAMLQIADPGKGMSPEIQHRVFEPFFTTKKTGEGSGLGLSTVLGIIEKHNGFIDLNSILGKGTIVTVILPIYKVSNEE